MITLREPIKLKNRAVSVTPSSFGDHIRENYEQMQASIEAEDLLHIVTNPAEIFYADGNQTSIFNRNIKLTNVNEQKVEIINKLINRIMISNQLGFTYQDRVYISNYLNKLGIRDEKSFMSKVTEMMTKQVNYTKSLSTLTQRLESLNEKLPELMESISKGADEDSDKNQAIYSQNSVSKNIFNRLQTDRIYDTVWNFNHIFYDERNITNRELSISEQKNSSTYLKLNNAASRVIGRAANMIDFNENIYISPKEYSEELLNENTIKNQLVENALYNLIEQVYISRSENINKGLKLDLNINNAMFESAGNIFTRYVDSIVSPIVKGESFLQNNGPVVEEVLNYLENQTDIYDSQEISLSDFNSLYNGQIKNEINESIVNQYVENILSPIVNKNISEISNEINRKENLSQTFINKELVNKGDEVTENITENVNQNITRTTEEKISQYLENIISPKDRESFKREENSFNNQTLNHIEEHNETSNAEDIIVQNLKRVEAQNILNENHYIRVMQQLQKRIDSGRPQVITSPDQIRKESLNALDNPSELLHKYKLDEDRAQRREEKDREEILGAYPEKIRPILQYINDIVNNQQNVTSINNIADPLSMLNSDIAAIELEHKSELIDKEVIEREDNKNTYVKKLVKEIEARETVRKAYEDARNLDEFNRDISLIHKHTDSINEEDILERIEEIRLEQKQKREETIENEDIVTSVNRVNREEHIVHESFDSAEISEIVRQNVISQMGELSDQVYSRIEKRLHNEKIRRGF